MRTDAAATIGMRSPSNLADRETTGSGLGRTEADREQPEGRPERKADAPRHGTIGA